MPDQCRILFMMDGDQSRERLTLMTRFLPILRQFHDVSILEGTETEDSLLSKLKEKPADLIILPWRKYQKWSRVDGLLGLNRTEGPEVCGYLGDPTLTNKLQDFQIKSRLILLDLDGMEPTESAQILSTLARDSQRSGLRPLFKDPKSIYWQSWKQSERLSNRADDVVFLPEFQTDESPWYLRENAIRVCVQALWGMVYQIGPGQDRIGGSSSDAIAHFHVGGDSNLLAMRVIYGLNRGKVKNTLPLFWPSKENASSPPQLLLRYADIVRINHFVDQDTLEITAILQHSSPSDRKSNYFHTLWISPLSSALLTEPAAPLANAKGVMKPLPATASKSDVAVDPAAMAEFKKKEKLLETAITKLKELQSLISKREEEIDDLKSGGVGTAAPLAPPDGASLLEAFQERYMDARFKIRKFQIEIQKMETEGSNELKIQQLKRQMLSLAEEERDWTKSLSEVLQTIKEERKKA